jgi:ribosomal protein S18 acetylase RimI-like enzyme
MTTSGPVAGTKSADGAIVIRSAVPDDADALSELAMRSKAHWGYDARFMELCRAELTMTAARMSEEEIVVAGGAERGLAGFASFMRGPDGTVEVMNCFVEPALIGTGIGHALMTELIARARTMGIAVMMVDSDPQAEGFYRRHGFRRVGEAPSGSIPGRSLPRLRLDL